MNPQPIGDAMQETAPRIEPDPRRWWALALLCGAFFMVILDAAIVTVALPSIEEELGFSAQGLQWVVSAYALTFAGLLLLGGRAADLLGRRRVFMVGLVLFTAASLLCGLAWSDEALIGARAFQGIGAAIMTPTALSIITTTFEEGAERNKALGIWGALGGIGATTAWLIGGPLVDGPGWEWIFFINIPVGLAALALAPVLLRESRAATARRSYDPAGALTITGALALLVYAIVEAPDTGWGDPQTILLLAGSAALLAAFVLIESRHRAPLVRLGIFRSRTIVGANAVMLVFGTLPYGLGFVLTLYAQQVLGYSAVKFGLTSLVFPAAAAVGSILGQGIVLRVGFRPVAAVGMALMGGGAFLLLRRHLLRAARLRPRRRPRLRHRLDRRPRRRRRARVGARLRAQQHELPDRRRPRRRDRHDRRRVADRRVRGRERRCEPARRADRGLPVGLPRGRHPRRDRGRAFARAPRAAARRPAGAARAVPGPRGRLRSIHSKGVSRKRSTWSGARRRTPHSVSSLAGG
jgi:EmrB/QacA subfamily drug resistance transporter